MVDYSKGKIYKIWDNGYNICYVGSTTQPLSKRMECHRRAFKKYLNGEYHNITVFSIFREYGVENCKIEWVENYECNSKEELHSREGYYIKNTDCVNRCIAGRTTQQWKEDNKERVKATTKQYRENNQDKIKLYREDNREKAKEYKLKYDEDNKDKIKQYREDNKDIHKELKRQWYQNNEYRLKQNRKDTFVCECGSSLTKCNYLRHNKTIKHQNYLKTLEPTEQSNN